MEFDAESSQTSTNDIFTDIGGFNNKSARSIQTTQISEPITKFFRRNGKSFLLSDTSCKIFDQDFNLTSQIKFKENYLKVFEKNKIIFCPATRKLDIYDEMSHELVISKQFGIATNDIAFKDNRYF